LRTERRDLSGGRIYGGELRTERRDEWRKNIWRRIEKRKKRSE
jgi:hypothetical protein